MNVDDEVHGHQQYGIKGLLLILNVEPVNHVLKLLNAGSLQDTNHLEELLTVALNGENLLEWDRCHQVRNEASFYVVPCDHPPGGDFLTIVIIVGRPEVYQDVHYIGPVNHHINIPEDRKRVSLKIYYYLISYHEGDIVGV
jgi:hypothetical protein